MAGVFGVPGVTGVPESPVGVTEGVPVDDEVGTGVEVREEGSPEPVGSGTVESVGVDDTEDIEDVGMGLGVEDEGNVFGVRPSPCGGAAVRCVDGRNPGTTGSVPDGRGKEGVNTDVDDGTTCPALGVGTAKAAAVKAIAVAPPNTAVINVPAPNVTQPWRGKG